MLWLGNGSALIRECQSSSSVASLLAHPLGKWRLLLPGASEPRLTLLRRQGFKSVFQTAYAA